MISIVISGGSLLVLATLGDVSAPVAVGLLLVMIFAQQFYVPLGAHMRQIIPDGLMGRASTLTALSGVAGIPLMQTAFGVVLDLAEKAGVSLADQYRFGFAIMGLMILLAGRYTQPQNMQIRKSANRRRISRLPFEISSFAIGVLERRTCFACLDLTVMFQCPVNGWKAMSFQGISSRKRVRPRDFPRQPKSAVFKRCAINELDL